MIHLRPSLFSIRYKIYLFILLPFCIISVVYFIISESVLQVIYQDNVAKETEVTLKRLSGIAQDGILSADNVKLNQAIYDEKNYDPAMRFVVVFAPDGKIKASTITGNGPDILDPAKDLSHGDLISTITYQGKDIFVVDHSIVVGIYSVGTLRIGLDFSDFNDQLNKSRIRFGLVGMSVLLILIVLIFQMLTQIVRPIVKLTAIVKGIATGSSTDAIYIKSNDEIGILAKNFEVMRVNIAQSDKDINDLIKKINIEKEEVERVVVVRTQELAMEKARMLASINSLPFGFIIADADDHVVLMNPSMSRILGLKDVPQSMHEIADILKSVAKEASNIDTIGTCRECMNLGKVVRIKEVLFGTKFLQIECAPVLRSNTSGDTEEEKPLGYVFLVQDITESKVLERSRDEFFSIASHELRTPLTAIRGNTEMIMEMYKDKITDKDVNEMLGDINTASVRLIEIVNDFLEVSRIEQGKLEIKLESFDLIELIAKVTRNLQTVMVQKHLTLAHAPSDFSTAPVHADKNRIEQILINLIGNSIKFTSTGGITISLDKADGLFKVRVSDTGLGISAENQSRLFGKFQQAGESMLARDVTQGTGLGLYISRLLISAMGGTIGLEKSELGKGSTFAFTVPIAS